MSEMRRWELAAYGQQHLSQVRVPRPVLVSSSKSKLQRVKALGTTHGIDRSEHEDWDARVLEITGGRGADHVLEMGGDDDMIAAIDHLKLRPVVDAVYPFSQAPEAFAHLKRGTVGKVVVRIER